MIARKILLEKSHLDYLEHFRRLHNLSSGNEAVRCILEQHQLYFSQTEGSVGQIIAAVLEEKYSEFLRSIRASTQSTEHNSQIMLELFNTLFLNQFTNISHATSKLCVQHLSLVRSMHSNQQSAQRLTKCFLYSKVLTVKTTKFFQVRKRWRKDAVWG